MGGETGQGSRGWYVGLMTGTVLDGNIDAALLETDGEQIFTHGHYRLIPYAARTSALLAEALAQAQHWQFAPQRPRILAEAERQLTLAQSAAVQQLLKEADMGIDQIRGVGFHGQTVLHRAPIHGQVGRTCQLGDGALMAATLGCPVVNDFRTADMVSGGQGAPLSAVYHRALLQRAGIGTDSAVLNLGGVANLTWSDGEQALVAFDTGPANAPINDFVSQRGLGQMDRDGRLAASGHVDEARLEQLLQHEYLQRPWPKSLDRNDFSADMARGCTDADGAALLTAFVAAAVDRALALLPVRSGTLVLCGGGRHNPTLLGEIEKRARVRCLQAEQLGWRGDAIEAECFAFLAARRMRGLPASYPGTTGTAAPCLGGVVHCGGIH